MTPSPSPAPVTDQRDLLYWLLHSDWLPAVGAAAVLIVILLLWTYDRPR